ncbi:MAG: hypothetical protein ABSA21_10365 [Candidatus Limnocylindrales bacterium]
MPELSPAYTEMRDTLLANAPETSKAKAPDELPHVYALVTDVGFELLFTVAAYADGTTSVYDGKGGAAVGLGDAGEIAALNRALLREIEAHLDWFAPVESTPLPAFGLVRFTVLTYEGRLGVEVDGPSLLRGLHPLTKAFAAVMAIMEQARRSTSRKQ